MRITPRFRSFNIEYLTFDQEKDLQVIFGMPIKKLKQKLDREVKPGTPQAVLERLMKEYSLARLVAKILMGCFFTKQLSYHYHFALNKYYQHDPEWLHYYTSFLLNERPDKMHLFFPRIIASGDFEVKWTDGEPPLSPILLNFLIHPNKWNQLEARFHYYDIERALIDYHWFILMDTLGKSKQFYREMITC